MITVNLKDLYPWVTEDKYIEITEEMHEAILSADRQESAYRRRTSRYKAHFSLDYAEWAEHDILHKVPSAEQSFEHQMELEWLYNALDKLSETQQRRVCAFYMDELNKAKIGRQEEVCGSSIAESVKQALIKLEKELAEYFKE